MHTDRKNAIDVLHHKP